tara:strand:+ start:232 stop:990 length:759 start_codon:yes stop_codon:yes gene_type:complete
MDYIPRLKKKYNEEVISNLRSNYKSVMQVPRLVKICLNQGVNAITDKKQLESAQQEMTIITGQKAVLTKSKKDISNFKLRKGMPVGVMVTLRGNNMYEFLDRLITSTLPRVRDFNGISTKGFDGRGNYTLGIKEQIAFPEISIDKINKVTGMDITFVTDTNSDEESLLLLTKLGLPFKKNDQEEKKREEEIKLKKEKEEKEKAAVEAKSKESENLVSETKETEDESRIEDEKIDTPNNLDDVTQKDENISKD